MPAPVQTSQVCTIVSVARIATSTAAGTMPAGAATIPSSAPGCCRAVRQAARSARNAATGSSPSRSSLRRARSIDSPAIIAGMDEKPFATCAVAVRTVHPGHGVGLSHGVGGHGDDPADEELAGLGQQFNGFHGVSFASFLLIQDVRPGHRR